MDYIESAILQILLLIIFSRVLGYLFTLIKIDSIVGEVFGGLILSPLLLNFVSYSEILEVFSSFSIIILMFLAGLMTNFAHFSRMKKQNFIIAFLGVLFSIILVSLVLTPFNFSEITIIVTAILLSNSAIEVCNKILVENSPGERIYSIIVGASFFDDVLAVVLVGIVLSTLKIESSISIITNIVVGIFFLILSIILIPSIFDRFEKLRKILVKKGRKTLLTFVIVFSFALALIAKLLGLSIVVGAYVAGLVTSKWTSKVGPTLRTRIAYENLIRDIQPIVTCIFGPFFFGYIGVLLGGVIALQRGSIDVILLSAALIVAAVAGKLIGCGLGAKLSGLDKKSAYLIGSTMIGRGALEMVLVEITYKMKVITSQIFVALVITTLTTIVIAPILYSYYYHKD